MEALGVVGGCGVVRFSLWCFFVRLVVVVVVGLEIACCFDCFVYVL